MKRYFLLPIILFLISCAAHTSGIQDLRQYPNAGLGYIEAGRDLSPDWYLDVWVQPEFGSNGRPIGKPNFSLAPQGKKQTQVYFVSGRIIIYARAWIWMGKKRMAVAYMKQPKCIQVRPVRDGDGAGWQAVISASDFGVEGYQSNRWSVSDWRW
jgi:hypothetical protein